MIITDILLLPEFWMFCAVGFLAQLIDGALGMAYGVVCIGVLSALGVPPFFSITPDLRRRACSSNVQRSGLCKVEMPGRSTLSPLCTGIALAVLNPADDAPELKNRRTSMPLS